MARYIALIIFFCLIILVLVRAHQLKKFGIQAMNFGKLDKRDFMIPPFVLFFIYLLIAGVFGLPSLGGELFSSAAVAVIGVILCLLGLALFIWALISFGKSFRVGLDEWHPGKLVTTGAFAVSRNPIYLAFGAVLAGIFLIIPNPIFLIYLIAALLLFNRQIKLEEQSLRKLYGQDYETYCQKIRRFL